MIYFYMVLVVLFGAIPAYMGAYRWYILPKREYMQLLALKPSWLQQQAQLQLEKKERGELRKRMFDVATVSNSLSRKLVESMSVLGIRYVPRSWEQKGNKKRYKKISVTHTMLGLDYVVFRISLPDRIAPHDILNDEFIFDLRILMGRPDLEIQADPYEGIFVKIPLRGSMAGVPDLFLWDTPNTNSNAINLLPVGNNYLPIGIGTNRIFYFVDLVTDPHVLIAGTTGGGKSNMLNGIICSLIKNNTPDNLQLVLLDMKRVELWPYRSIPHLWEKQKRIITDFDHVLPVLNSIRSEMEQRYNTLASHDLRNAQAWNEKNPHSIMPRIIVVFDEMADIMKDSKYGNEVTAILERLAAMTRAVDINFILCTQRPSVDVITGLIKANVSTRLAFAVPSDADSRTIIDNGSARGLAPKGRGVFLSKGIQYLVQTPLITDDQINKTIKSVVKAKKHQPGLTPVKLFEEMARPGLAGGLGDLWKRLEGYKDVNPQKVNDLLLQWHYVPPLQAPTLNVGHKKYILWAGKVLDVTGKELPTSAEEVEIMKELEC